MAVAPTYTLNNGLAIPALGLGTMRLTEENIKHAIDVGYRHFDSAFAYGNEDQVGKGILSKIAEGVVERKDIFVTTKLSNIHHDPELVEYACRKSLKNLGLEYIDLYLIHWPRGMKYVDDNTQFPKDSDGNVLYSDIDYLDTWKAMEQLHKKGLVRSIGLSNFTIPQIERILQNSEIKPVNNQVKYNPTFRQKDLVAFCAKEDITVTAWAPLGKPNFAEKTPQFHFDERTQAIAKKYNKTTPQIVLRYLIQNGVIPIPKSATQERVIANINVFDFKLSAEDMDILDSFDQAKEFPAFAEMQRI